MEWSLTPNAVRRIGVAGLPAGFDTQHDDHFVVRCGASAGVGLSLHETLHASAAGGAGRGVWLVYTDGVCRRERVCTTELLADVPRQHSLGGGL